MLETYRIYVRDAFTLGRVRTVNGETLTMHSSIDIHATNVAIQKTAPNYVASKGCKWLLRSLKRYVATHHGEIAAETLFSEMEQLVVRALLSVQKVMIHDKHCFELYGYDILVDDNLKP